MNSKTNITTFQLTFLLIHAQIGVGLLSMPHDIFQKTDSESWIVVLITGIIIQLFIFIYGALIKRFPNNNLFGIARLLLGKKLGNVVIILLSMFYILFLINVLIRFVYLLNAWMLPHTPRWVIIGLMCFVAVFIVKENIQIISRFSFIVSIVFTGFIISSVYALKDATFSYLLPVGTQGIMPIVEGIPEGLYSYFGFEILLILYPFVQPANKGITRAASIANVFVTSFYFLLTVVTVVSFSPKELLMIPEPVLFLMKAISFRVIERPDLFFTSMWIVLVATTVIICVYTSSLGLATVANKKNLKYFAFVVAVISFFGSLPFNDMFKINKISKITNLYIMPIVWGIPILFLILSIIFNKKESVKNK